MNRQTLAPRGGNNLGVSAPQTQPAEPGVRLAELIAALSLATDLGMGQPAEHALRTCLLSLGLGKALGVAESELREIYYLALLRRIGCTSDSYELGLLFGDDLAAHGRVFTLDFGRPVDVLADMLRHAGGGRSWWGRTQAIARAVKAGPGMPGMLFRASCEVAQSLAQQLGFGPNLLQALAHTFERWDGRGYPNHVRGAEIPVAARVVHVAEHAEVFERLSSPGGAVAMLRQSAGTNLDPALTDSFCEIGERLFQALAADSAWLAVLSAEPQPCGWLADEQFDTGLRALAHFADLKSPFTVNHSARIAMLVSKTASIGVPESEVVTLRRAALVHDIGRAGVPNGIWDKPGPLTDSEWERVRLHPYFTERVLSRSPALAALGALSAQHHERLDRSGYPHGHGAPALSSSARILAAADAYCAMTESRPHRPPLAPQAAADSLRADVRGGRLDGGAVDAVLAAAGHQVRRQREWPAGLSAREVEVLQLIARGISNREVARRLVISDTTVAAHVRHIYDKIGVTTRAGAALFAMQHALFDTTGLAEK